MDHVRALTPHQTRGKIPTMIQRINHILHTQWDPIGCGVPQDEYLEYAKAVNYLLVYFTTNEDYPRTPQDKVAAIADYLRYVCTHRMELPITGREVQVAQSCYNTYKENHGSD